MKLWYKINNELSILMQQEPLSVLFKIFVFYILMEYTTWKSGSCVKCNNKFSGNRFYVYQIYIYIFTSTLLYISK